MKDQVNARIRLAITKVTTLMSSANFLGSQLQLAQQKGDEIPSSDQIVERANYKLQQLELAALLKLGVYRLLLRNFYEISYVDNSQFASMLSLSSRRSLQEYLAWEDEPSVRPSDIEMQQKLKALFNEHVFSKGISPQIHPKKIDPGDIPNLELPRTFQEKVCITNSQQSNDNLKHLTNLVVLI
ncbi:5566_t:CDS:2 [Cetraspora pellucida]|uniref:5566_t:CDS:1 n=1 Tax=Cetraspora pellucida TaxID=1433469 RepID=A0A9N9CNX9_9GLOM|nr:5566_t:CDS:2 [Cetraspora pellucida]